MAENYTQDQHFERINDAGLFWQCYGPNFENCTFAACNFQKSDLSAIHLIDCRFEDCDLSLMEVEGTVLQKVDFYGCKVTGVLFDKCDPFALELKFYDTRLDHSSFCGLKMHRAIFWNCSLKGVDYTTAQLQDAQFTGADLLDATFDQTNLIKADFSAATQFLIDPERNNVRGATFSMGGLPGLLTAYKINVVP